MNYIYHDKLETPRLITRHVVPEDAATWAAFFEDPAAVEFLPDFNFADTTSRALHWIERQIERYETRSFGLQALTDKRTGAFIGMCGLLLQEIDGNQELEIGYHVFKQYWGQGYATEAAKAFKNYAFDQALGTSVVSIIHVNNMRSQRVALKNGMDLEKQVHWRGLDVYVYRARI